LFGPEKTGPAELPLSAGPFFNAHSATLRIPAARGILQCLQMTWKTIRLNMARTADYPEGSAAHAYVLRLPLDDKGLIDPAALKQHAERPVVRRMWRDERDRQGVVIRTRKGYAFSYEPGDADDENLFHLENHPLNMGAYVTITETDGERLPFRVVSCHD
jgi:hypothetical protein